LNYKNYIYLAVNLLTLISRKSYELIGYYFHFLINGTIPYICVKYFSIYGSAYRKTVDLQ
jgi:hypothetical protein